MFNKNVNVDLKMLFHWGKIKKISWNKLKKWTFKNVWTQFGVLHQKQSQEFMISAFYDYPWNQKSQNARTSCIFYYRMRAIISRGLYTFHPIFQCSLYCRAVIITDNLCTKQGNSSIFEPKIHSFKSRAGYNGAYTVYQFENFQTFYYSTRVQISNHGSRLRSVFRPVDKRSLAKLKRRSDYNCQIFTLISITLFSELTGWWNCPSNHSSLVQFCFNLFLFSKEK